jgi:hypothetical protein
LIAPRHLGHHLNLVKVDVRGVRRAICLASAALFVLPALPAPGADDAVRLIVRSNKSVVAPYEPVIVTYDLENVSKDPQDVPALIDFATGWVKFEISDETGAFRPYHTGIQGATAWESVTLKPGERLSGQVIVLTNAFGRAADSNPTDFGDVPVFPFGKSGRYKVRVTYPLERGSESESRQRCVETLQIAVKESTSAEADLKAFANLDDLAAAVGADSHDVDMAEAVERWERLVQLAPNSVFAPFLRFNLATNYKYGVGTASPDFTRAAAHFWAVATSGPRELADDALVGFAEAQIELGDYAGAAKALERVLSDYAPANATRLATRLRDDLASRK